MKAGGHARSYCWLEKALREPVMAILAVAEVRQR